ncbi:MAG: lysophospholipid acyltransferase family protein, partial [bacterium]|nr:lysophospholipid acyltransferase family protein [bacterium]
QVARMEVITERSAAADAIKAGKEIYAINHKSFFDFCLAPYAYMKLKKDGSAASFIPRIMVAKDHFKDNFFLYKIVGFGQMLEAWGMIFVDRKSKEPNKARRSVAETARKILAGDLAFSIYPQGTRALGQLWRDGSRWDAGYFCVGKVKRLKQEMGHLKKGVAYIAVETASALARHNASVPVYVVPVGMEGIGTACPSGSLRVQTETRVVIRLGDPIVVEPTAKVEDVLRSVDAVLQRILDVATRLERRFFTDLHDIVDARGVDEVAVALKEWRKDKNYIVYVILDCIYALPPKFWHGFLTELANLLRHECTREELVTLRNKIADCF